MVANSACRLFEIADHRELRVRKVAQYRLLFDAEAGNGGACAIQNGGDGLKSIIDLRVGLKGVQNVFEFALGNIDVEAVLEELDEDEIRLPVADDLDVKVLAEAPAGRELCGSE